MALAAVVWPGDVGQLVRCRRQAAAQRSSRAGWPAPQCRCRSSAWLPTHCRPGHRWIRQSRRRQCARRECVMAARLEALPEHAMTAWHASCAKVRSPPVRATKAQRAGIGVACILRMQRYSTRRVCVGHCLQSELMRASMLVHLRCRSAGDTTRSSSLHCRPTFTASLLIHMHLAGSSSLTTGGLPQSSAAALPHAVGPAPRRMSRRACAWKAVGPPLRLCRDCCNSPGALRAYLALSTARAAVALPAAATPSSRVL